MPTRSHGGAKKRVAPAHDQAVQSIGAVPAPQTNEIIKELKCAIGHALLELRAFDGTADARARVIRALTQSVKDLVAIGHLEELGRADLSKLSDEQLAEHAQRLLKQLN